MKLKRTIVLAAVLATSWVTMPLTAQNTKPDARASGDQGAMKDRSATSPANLEKAKQIIGMEITDSQGNKAGKVKDLAVDLQNGRIAEVIVSYDGGDKATAVPPTLFTTDTSTKTLKFNGDGAKLKDAPTFAYSQWKDSTASPSVADVYKRYDLPDPGYGTLERATSIMGDTVRDSQDKKLGRVNSVIVDVPDGRIAKVIISSGGFLGIHTELSLVSPQAFKFDPARETLTLDLSKGALKNAPHFKSRDWREHVTDQAYDVSGLTGMPPVETTTDVTAMPKPMDGATPPPAASQNNDKSKENMTVQGNDASQPNENKSDEAITTEIQQKIMAADDLSYKARNAVQIHTQNGRVTLTGKVDLQSEKLELGDIAATVVTVNNVDNQIEVVATGPLSANNGGSQ